MIGALGLLAGAARAGNPLASATIVDATGKTLGTVVLEEAPNGVLVMGELSGLPPGPHGFHFHERGACEPTFEAAGGHFNPTHAEHGFRAGHGPHLGDLTNLVVPPSGRVKIDKFVAGVSLGEGANSLLRMNGTALVIHADADDYITQPTGASGGRIACGVVKPLGVEKTM